MMFEKGKAKKLVWTLETVASRAVNTRERVEDALKNRTESAAKE